MERCRDTSPSRMRTLMRPTDRSPSNPLPAPTAPFTDAYVEACRLARLRRSPDRLGRETIHLRLGDHYAWREGTPSSPGPARVSLISDPRPVLITDDRVWWVPRLDQLLERLETVMHRREPEMRAVREVIALSLAERLRDGKRTWEEAALEVLLNLP